MPLVSTTMPPTAKINPFHNRENITGSGGRKLPTPPRGVTEGDRTGDRPHSNRGRTNKYFMTTQYHKLHWRK